MKLYYDLRDMHYVILYKKKYSKDAVTIFVVFTNFFQVQSNANFEQSFVRFCVLTETFAAVLKSEQNRVELHQARAESLKVELNI